MAASGCHGSGERELWRLASTSSAFGTFGTFSTRSPLLHKVVGSAGGRRPRTLTEDGRKQGDAADAADAADAGKGWE